MTELKSENICRWGFLSTALIGRKNWLAIKNSGNARVAAVASRTIEKAEQFIDQCQATVPFEDTPLAFGSYDQLLASESVDAVYIPLPTGLRKEWVIKAAESGKHVLCEKPCATSADELQLMIDACRANNVQFMDGIMYMHSERLPRIREAMEAADGIGKLKRIAMQFSFCADQDFHKGNIRTNSELEPQGCLGDLGWYTIRFALWVMKFQMPRRVTSIMINQHHREDSPSAVPMEVESRLEFDDDVTCTFYNSFLTGHQQWVHLAGTEGHLKVKDFVLPYAGNELHFYTARPEFSEVECEFKMTENRKDYVVSESGHGTTDAQETKLFRKFSSLVNQGTIEPHWPDYSIKTQRILDACMDSAASGKTIEL